MQFTELPDLVLQHIFLNLDTKDISSLQGTTRRFHDHINEYRQYYSQNDFERLIINKGEDGRRQITLKDSGIFKKTSLPGKLEDLISSANPRCLYSYDHEELINMSQRWWKKRKEIALYDIVDYRRYLHHFDRCTSILLISDYPKNLTEILMFKQTKNLKYFSVNGSGALKCTNEDLLKIARLSDQLWYLELKTMSDSSIISNETILKMFEIGSFQNNGTIKLSRIQNVDEIEQLLWRKSWVRKYDRYKNKYRIFSRDENVYWIEWKRQETWV